MTDTDTLHFRDLLMERRKQILDGVREMQGRWEDLKERTIEPVEEAQKANITEAYDKLDERAKRQIEQIDLALSKLALGEYGFCESCGDDIALKRLEALPWARLCVECAREYERKGKSLPPTVQIVGSVRLPDKFQGLTKDQVVGMIYDHFRTDGRVETEELDISLRNGVIYLDGIIAGELEHQIIMQTLTEVMGFRSIVDHMELTEPIQEKSERPSGRT